MANAVTRLLRNTASNIGFRVINIALGFVSVPVLINHVGEEGFGLIVLMGAITGYFQLFGVGVPTGTVKYVAELDANDDRDGLHGVVDTSFGFFAAIGIAIAVGLVGFATFGGMDIFVSAELSGDAKLLCYIAATTAIFSWPGMAFGSTLSGLQKYHTKNIIETTCLTLGQVATIAAAIAGWSLPMVFLVAQVFKPVRVIWTIIVTANALGYLPSPLGFSKKAFKLIFGLSALIALNQLAILLNVQTDKVIVGAALPVGMVSVYAILAKPGELISTFSSLINSAILPAISAAEQTHGEEGVNVFIYRVARYVNALTSAFSIIALYLCAPFIALWVGEKYLDGVWITQAMCAAMLIWQSNAVLARVYYATNNALKPALLSVVGALANVGLSLVLVHEIGVEGVLLSTIITGTLVVVLQYIWILPDYGVARWRYFKTVVVGADWPAVVAGLLLIPAADWILAIRSWPLFLATGTGLSLVIFPLSLWNALEKGDLERLRAEARRILKR